VLRQVHQAQAITGSWSLVFYTSSAVYLLGALSWLLLDPVTPLDRRPHEQAG
jgi:hypothetical protein